MIFPPSLGKFLAQGYAYNLDPGFVKTKVQSGRSRYRQRANQPTMINVSLIANLSQMAVLEAFIRNDGRNWFDAQIAIDGEVAYKTVRIASVGETAKSGIKFTQSMKLELYQHANEYDTMTAEEREVFYNYEPAEISEAATVDPDAPLYGFS